MSNAPSPSASQGTSPGEVILVPVDFGEPSRAATERALSLAETQAAEIQVLHVHSLPGLALDSGASGQFLVEIRRKEREALRDFAAGLSAHAVAVSTRVRDGDPVHEIHDAAREPEVRLLVVGSHGRTGLERLVLGSTAERVVQGAAVPVLVVRSTLEEASQPIRSILMATDFSKDAQSVEPLVADLARRYSAEVEVIHVIRETAVLFAPYAVEGSTDFEGEMMDSATARMKSVLSRLADLGIQAKSKIVYGHAEDEILARAESTNAGMIALGTRGYSGIQSFLLGSVAQRVLARATCDVLVSSGAAGERGSFSKHGKDIDMAEIGYEEQIIVGDERNAHEGVVANEGLPTGEELAVRLYSIVMFGVLAVIVAMIVMGDY